MSRKIIHIDMDAFYASVELKNYPHLIHKPIAIASHRPRAVITTASYPARQFGIRSAMPVHQAKKLCPQLIIIEPNFEKYRQISNQLHGIFEKYTSIIEPISLDEAYLDVTHHSKTATEIAFAIQKDIYNTTQLTASAGVAPNKFLAKIASDWQKPNGIFIIKPHQVQTFIQNLSLEKVPGVGKVTQQKLQQFNLHTLADVQKTTEQFLVQNFGKYGTQLYLYSHGIDERPVQATRIRQQISKEMTFDQNYTFEESKDFWNPLITQVWQQLEKRKLLAYGITIKFKEPNFHTIQHSKRFNSPFSAPQQIHKGLLHLISELNGIHHKKFRLIGIGVYHLIEKNEIPQLNLW